MISSVSLFSVFSFLLQTLVKKLQSSKDSKKRAAAAAAAAYESTSEDGENTVGIRVGNSSPVNR